MILHYIPKDQLRQSWDFVKQGLEIVRSKGHSEWIVEDVYADLIANRSLLWVALKNERFGGFFILQPSGIHLHVWAAWTLENDYLIVEKGLKYIKQSKMQILENMNFFERVERDLI